MNAEKTNTNMGLEQKLKLISELETKYGIVGVSFAVRDGETVLTEEAADYVIAAIETGVKHLQRIDTIPLSTVAS